MNPMDVPLMAIVDDDAAVCRSLALLLETRGWRSESFERAADLLALDDCAPFNCLIVDVRIPGMSGLELFDALGRRATSQVQYLPPVLFLTGHGDIPMVVHALKNGASDFLEKPADPRSLLDAVKRALETDRVARQRFDDQARLTRLIAGLTRRERQILGEVLKGRLSKQVGDVLNISTKTVEAHRLSICHKFGVRTTAELSAMLRGLPDDLWLE